MIVAFIYFVVGVLLGGLLGALIASLMARGSAAREAQGRASAEARATELDRQRQELVAKLEAAQSDRAQKGEQLARAEAEKSMLANAQEVLRNSFKALAADALRDNNAHFLENANTLIGPLQQTLGRLQGEIQGMEGQRQEAYKNLLEELEQLQRETGNLVAALRQPQGRGRWGEMTLRRAVELAGMSEHCDFTEQAYLEGEEGLLRPDLVVHLAGKKEIVVDSKAPLDAYLDAQEAPSEKDRAEALKRHAIQVRKHMEQLSDKSYWSQLPTSPDFVVLFLPGESFFSAALEQDHTLIDSALQKNLLLATPTTLIALLKSVAYGWRQEQVAENARQISTLGRELYDRVATLTEYLQDLGEALGKAVDSYNHGVGSYNSRVLVATRKFKELGATVSEDIPLLESVDEIPRLVGQQSLDLNGKPDHPPEAKKER